MFGQKKMSKTSVWSVLYQATRMRHRPFVYQKILWQLNNLDWGSLDLDSAEPSNKDMLHTHVLPKQLMWTFCDESDGNDSSEYEAWNI